MLYRCIKLIMLTSSLLLISELSKAQSSFEGEADLSDILEYQMEKATNSVRSLMGLHELACEQSPLSTESVEASLVMGEDAKNIGKVSVVDEARLQRIFRDLKNQKHIPFEFNIEGCLPRAHEMAKYLESLYLLKENWQRKQ